MSNSTGRFIIPVLAISLIAIFLMADVPARVNYQGRLTVGSTLLNGTKDIIVRVYSAPAAGTLLYSETNTNVTINDGLYSMTIGDEAGFENILTNAALYLELAIDGQTFAPREKLDSVPYSLMAKNSLNLNISGLSNETVIANNDTLAIYDTSAGAVREMARSDFFAGADGDFKANGSVPMTGLLNLNGRPITNVSHLTFNDGNVEIGSGARSYSTVFGSVCIGNNATARYRGAGVAIGTDSDGDYNGIGIGFSADGQYTNIAIGFESSAYSGYDRIAIGRQITNRYNHSIAVRGCLYLDGAPQRESQVGNGDWGRIFYRDNVGTGRWYAKAFTIDHPKDPDNKVLRHFCLEGPQVWNLYAGNAQLADGTATIQLPDYYSALNLAGSEVYSLTPIGDLAQVAVKTEVKDNQFTIMGDKDVKVSWTIKVLRNDPGCLEDLKRRPVEQDKSELLKGQAEAENQSVNTVQVKIP